MEPLSDPIPIPLSTVRGLYVLLGSLMERHADTPVMIDNPETGLHIPRSLCVCDTEDECKGGETIAPITIVIDPRRY